MRWSRSASLQRLLVGAGVVLVLATPAKSEARDRRLPSRWATNANIVLGATWGNTEYVTPLDGAFSFSLRAEGSYALRPGSWALGVYGELTDPGSLFQARWLGGGGLQVLTPPLWIFGGSLSTGLYGRDGGADPRGDYAGFTAGAAFGLRPRAFWWDFLLAVRVDYRQALGRHEQSFTVGVQLDVGILFALGGMALKGSFRFR